MKNIHNQKGAEFIRKLYDINNNDVRNQTNIAV